jgi:hypothetical protein
MLRGSGVEFGPRSSPFPAPIECDVSFADFLPMGDLERRKYPGQVNDFAELSHIMSCHWTRWICPGRVLIS